MDTPTSKMEQRYDAVLGVIRDGFSVTEVARKFGVSRQSVHAGMARYEAGGLEALAERSRRPKASPGQIDGAVESRILELRRHLPNWASSISSTSGDARAGTPCPRSRRSVAR